VEELLAALKTATVREDGLSKTPNFTHPETVDLPAFEWSFDFQPTANGKTCAPLKFYAPDEACSLLSAFGGYVVFASRLPSIQLTLSRRSIFITGDSYMRHFSNALFMLLRGRTDGAINNYRDANDCRKDGMFDDSGYGEKVCRYRVWRDTNKEEPVCGGNAIVSYAERCVSFPLPNEAHLTNSWYSAATSSMGEFDSKASTRCCC
jgi:hypothetical protein